MNAIRQSILETVGATPIVKINRLGPSHVKLYAKIEAFNPMGSVKDRLALGVIEAAEQSGELKPGQTVIDATSGNTGIGLAMVCAAKGYPLVVTMAESFSLERRKLLRFLGAQVVLTPAAEKGTGMYKKAAELAEAHGWYLVRQFENQANADMHARTTGPEIVEAFAGEGLDYWVTGFGTGGTLQGVGRALREHSPQTKIIVCEPDNAQILGSGVGTPRQPDGAPAASHPNFRPHLMQGWSPDFIPKLTEDALNLNLIDGLQPINGEDAMRCSRELAQKEGLFVGTSGGATFAGALAVAQAAPEGANILCMLPDTGERYLSTPLFADVPVEMTETEQALSRSTPSCRFDRPAPPPPADAAPAPEVTAKAKTYVDEVVGDAAQPVTMFALEWCEFCWSVRKLFKHMDLDYRSVDLDSVAYQDGGWGGEVRTALNDRTGMKTIPQIFVGGAFIGGCTETFDAFKAGELQNRLKRAGAEYNEAASVDPYTLFPQWLHPR